jgi:hypothetical protein
MSRDNRSGCGCSTVVFVVLAVIAVKHCTEEDVRAPVAADTRVEQPAPRDRRLDYISRDAGIVQTAIPIQPRGDL